MDNLGILIAAYFHQDWHYVHGTWQAAVDEFVSQAPKEARRTPSEIDALLRTVTDDRALEERLFELGLDDAVVDGGRPWLEQVRDRIRGQFEAK